MGEVLEENVSAVEVFGGLVVNYPGVMEFAEAAEVHGHFVVQAH